VHLDTSGAAGRLPGYIDYSIVGERRDDGLPSSKVRRRVVVPLLSGTRTGGPVESLRSCASSFRSFDQPSDGCRRAGGALTPQGAHSTSAALSTNFTFK